MPHFFDPVFDDPEPSLMDLVSWDICGQSAKLRTEEKYGRPTDSRTTQSRKHQVWDS